MVSGRYISVRSTYHVIPGIYWCLMPFVSNIFSTPTYENYMSNDDFIKVKVG